MTSSPGTTTDRRPLQAHTCDARDVCESTASASASAILTIDLAAVRANYRLLRDRLTGASCAAVVKADAYGLGALKIAPALHDEGCRHFFVAHLDEGLALKTVLPPGIDIFILNGLPFGAENTCLEAGLIPVLNSLEQLEAWGAAARRTGRSLPAVLQVDSGMARLGLSPSEVDRIATEPDRLSGLVIRLVMSHLACADDPTSAANGAQLAAFRALRDRLPAAPAALANSSGIFLGPDYHFDLARPGAALYGLRPTDGVSNPMRPVVRLDARVIQVRTISKGTPVGYSHTWHAGSPSRIATLSVGYADGWLRHLSNGGTVYFGELPMPIVGRVSMDSITVDATALAPETLHPGALVELIGPHQTVDDVAAQAGTIGYEILTSLGDRYHRIYRN